MRNRFRPRRPEAWVLQPCEEMEFIVLLPGLLHALGPIAERMVWAVLAVDASPWTEDLEVEQAWVGRLDELEAVIQRVTAPFEIASRVQLFDGIVFGFPGDCSVEDARRALATVDVGELCYLRRIDFMPEIRVPGAVCEFVAFDSTFVHFVSVDDEVSERMRVAFSGLVPAQEFFERGRSTE